MKQRRTGSMTIKYDDDIKGIQGTADQWEINVRQGRIKKPKPKKEQERVHND
jgi:hypothetical protein